MSLKRRVIQSVNKAFNALDDLAGPMTVNSQTSDPVYNTSTGALTKSQSSFTVEAVFDKYETDRVDGTVIQREDRLILVKPVTNFVPKVGDTITDAGGIDYNIMDVEAITAYDEVFLWEIQARR